MCDQTEVEYLDEDVVWVKIGSTWWPGVVKDIEKDEENKKLILGGLKKKPIAVVKFFQEDNYEIVKNLDHIYHYNCRRKDEFIKKGLDKVRNGAPHFEKFPMDVTTAESLTNGDVNIVNDPKFYPEKRESYSEIFGSPKKKRKKDLEISPRTSAALGAGALRKSSAGVTPYRPITHKRFIDKALRGESDHKVKTLIQTTSGSEDGVSGSPYRCHICKFETSRVNVIVAHHRLSHSPRNSINWTGSDGRSVKRRPAYKSRKSKTKKVFDSSKEASSDEEDAKDDDNADADYEEKKKSPKSKKERVKSPEKVKGDKTPVSSGKRRGRPEAQGGSDSKKPRFTDVLLADWNEEEDDDKKNKEEDEDNENDKDKDEDKKDEDDEKGDKKDGNDGGDKKTNEESPKSSGEGGEKKNEGKSGDSDLSDKKSFTEKTSCFDFDEEEEGFIGMSNANTYGRKIPRVIPVKDKPELGMDLEIEELFKKKTESESNSDDVAEETERNSDEKSEVTDSNETNDNEKKKPKTPGRRGRKKKIKQEEEVAEIKEEVKVSKTIKTEESLALRRTRRPGAKKSYLNEVIEKIEEPDSALEEKEKEKEMQENGEVAGPSGVVMKPETIKVTKEENVLTTPVPTFSPPLSTPSPSSSSSSSSRRKQDFKHQTIDGDREEMVYSDILNNDQKIKTPDEKKKGRSQHKREPSGDDLTLQIDSLLEQTKLPSLPEVTTSSSEDSKSTNTTSFSFDFHLPAEQTGKKVGKNKAEVKSISRMFSDSIPNSENNAAISEPLGDNQETSGLSVEDGKESPERKIDGSPGKSLKVSQTGVQKRGSIVLSSTTKPTEGQVKVLPVARQTVAATKDCIVLPTAKKVGVEEVKQGSEGGGEVVARPKSIKTFKVKSDSLPSGLIAAGKLKGQTIIHQKGGKYVIVTQPPQLGRQRTATGKVPAGSKVVILTNQLGEQKIITTSGLQQTKFKLEGQKIVTATVGGATDSNAEIDASASTSSGAPNAGGNGNGQSQPIIKMVPDGKGGIMKQLTVSPKKVLLGGTKVLVSGSGSSLSSAGSTVQKIALTTGGGVARAAGGDYRLIENYKGSGRTVLIQGGPSPSSGVVLKSSAIVPRQVTKVLQNPQGLKRKPKILMRTTGGQGEYVMQAATGTIEAPTYVVKQKGPDGKFSTQKIVRTELVGQPKVATSVGGTKAFFLAGQGPNKKGESFIITTNEAVPSKVIRMRQKVKDVGGTATGKVIGKSSELYAISPNSLLLPATTLAEGETSQVIQIQEAPQPQPQQPQQQPQAQQPVLQTQVIAMPGPVGADGNQTYVLVSVDEHGVVQGMDNSVVTYDTTQSDQIFLNSTTTSTTNNVILINPAVSEESTPVFSTSSQDILAEALANTNVLEGTINTEMDSVVPSILLPPSIPSSVVQETSITLQKPIMTPLEMPSSVAPDTSGLEPPPLPPTPTEEDVLMEETEMVQEPLMQENDKKEGELNEAIQTYLQPETFEGGGDETTDSFQVTDFAKENENQKTLDEGFDSKTNKSDENVTETKSNDFYSSAVEFANENATSGHEDFKELPREDFLMDSSQEEQSTNSFQSMPLLNDEPDTSDDAQGSEPIASQQFDVQKARLESEQFSQLIREQEPPSSTNNEITSESNHESQEGGFDGSKYESYHHSIYEDENCENEPKNKEPMADEKVSEQEQNGDEIGGGGGVGGIIGKDKDPESQSMPIIADESNVNAYEMDPIYSDVLSQKRFQEETEVSSTTDEYAGKDGGN